MKIQALRFTLALILVATFCTGCLIVSSRSEAESGVRVSHSTFNQIEPGVTSEAWLLATLGEPTSRSTVMGQEHTQILRYDHVVKRSSSGAVFLIFAGDSDYKSVQRTYFELADGTVNRYWTESSGS